MDSAISIIDELLGVVQRETGAGAFMSRVGASRGESALNRRRECAGADRTRPAAVSDRFESPIPTRGWHPNFDFDVGVAGWLERRRDPAIRRQIFVRCNGLGGSDRGVLQRKRCQTVA